MQTTGILVLQVLFACLAGYGFSKVRFRGRDAWFLVVIACLVVPPQVRFVPLYMLFSKLGLLNSYASLILPYAVSALGTFLIREAFMQISDDIVDAARVDGAGLLTIIFRVMVPIARPTIVAFALFSVVYHWNDFFWLLVMTTNDAVRTLPIGVAMLREEGTGTRWNVVMAGSMFLVAPMLARLRRRAAPHHPGLHVRVAQVAPPRRTTPTPRPPRTRRTSVPGDGTRWVKAWPKPAAARDTSRVSPRSSWSSNVRVPVTGSVPPRGASRDSRTSSVVSSPGRE